MFHVLVFDLDFYFWKEGKILSHNPETQQVDIEILSSLPAMKEPGKFDLVYHNENGTEVVEYAVTQEKRITVFWRELIDPRLIVEPPSTIPSTEPAWGWPLHLIVYKCLVYESDYNLNFKKKKKDLKVVCIFCSLYCIGKKSTSSFKITWVFLFVDLFLLLPSLISVTKFNTWHSLQALLHISIYGFFSFLFIFWPSSSHRQ